MEHILAMAHSEGCEHQRGNQTLETHFLRHKNRDVIAVLQSLQGKVLDVHKR